MKILFCGGGSGGHFYPIIAVVEALEKIAENEKLIKPVFYYMAPEVRDARMLYDHDITYIPVTAGKMRLYFSVSNILDLFKTAVGCVTAFFKMFAIYPDVVFGKGGFGSFPALLAARILRIPILIHESDSVPGRVNKWAGKFADRIAVSYAEAAQYFPKERVAWTGQPVRMTIKPHPKEEAYKLLKLEPNYPILLVMGGSLGAELLNDAIIESLNELLTNWQIIHQTGRANLKDAVARSEIIVKDKALLGRYRPFDFLSDSALSMASGVANLVISRAGSTIFEIASWGIPSIVVPITISNGNHQRHNAFIYASSGAAVSIEEANLSPHILVSEIEHIRNSPELQSSMAAAAKSFSKMDASEKIAKGLISIAKEHGSH